MARQDLILIETICFHYKIEISFIIELENIGLIKTETVENNKFIHQDKISDLEKMIESLRKQQQTWSEVERAAIDGDSVNVDFEGSIEDFQRNFDNYKERGYNEHAAQAMAVESLESGETPRESTRFARLNS